VVYLINSSTKLIVYDILSIDTSAIENTKTDISPINTHTHTHTPLVHIGEYMASTWWPIHMFVTQRHWINLNVCRLAASLMSRIDSTKSSKS
jgi:hypothetical protein